MPSAKSSLPANVYDLAAARSLRERSELSPGRSKRTAVAFYAAFPDHWAAFIDAFFDGDVIEAARAFRTSHRGAEKWAQGIGGARADKLAWAMVSIPGAAAWWLDRLGVDLTPVARSAA